jgi:hypothetical protein
MVRLVRAVIAVLGCLVYTGKGRAGSRHKPFSSFRKRPGFKLGAHFLLRFMRDSGGLGAGLTGLMAKNSDHLAGTFETENTGGVLSGLLAEEDDFDRHALWRIGSWGVAAIAAVVVAVMANQTSLGWRRDQLAAADLTRQAQQLQSLTRESQNETRRLASAIDTLNSDRDRLYSRVTFLEQGLDSVTGTIARQGTATAQTQAVAPKPAAMMDAQLPVQNQAAAPAVVPATTTVAPATTTVAPATTTVAPATTTVAPVTTTVLAKTDPAPKADKSRTEAAAKEQNPAPAPPASPAASNVPVATPPTPATPLITAKSILAPPDSGALKLIEPDKPAAAKTDQPPAPEMVASVAAKEPDASDAASTQVAVQRTEFAVDVGSANSIGGLRALWRGLTKSNSELAGLRPIIMVKESATGLGMQLRLAAGPLTDAAAAAKICAALIESQRTCETTVFDGQRLAMKADEQLPALKPVPPQPHRRNYSPKRASKDDPPKSEPSNLSRLFSR